MHTNHIESCMSRIVNNIKRTRPTKGWALSSGVRRVVITFDDEAFEQIQAEAERRNMTFSALCREIIAAGLAPE